MHQNDNVQDHYNPNDFNPLNFKEKEYIIRLKYLRNGGLALSEDSARKEMA